MTHSHAPAPPAVAAVVAAFPPSVRRVHRILLEGRNFSPTAEHPGATVMRRSVIAAKAGVDESTVRRATTMLAKAGVIAKLHRGRSRAMAYFHAIREPFDMPDGNRNQPVLLLALPGAAAPVDNSPKKEAKKEARRPEKGGESPPQKGGESPPLVFQGTSFQDSPSVSAYVTTAREGVDNYGGGIETDEQPDRLAAELDDAAGRIRARVGAWPRHPAVRGRLAAWLAAGWSIDHLVSYLRDKTAAAAVRDPGGVIGAALREAPLDAPWTPNQYRPLAWHARIAALQEKDAENGTGAPPVAAKRPQTPVDPITAMFGALLRGERSEDVLDPIEGRTDAMAATGTGG